MSVITENNKDHLLNYEGVEQLLVKINDRFARTDRYATPDTLGMIKAEINTDVNSEDIYTGDNHPVQITTDGTAFVNVVVPEYESIDTPFVYDNVNPSAAVLKDADNNATARYAFAGGTDASAGGYASIAYGDGVITRNPGEAAFGKYNKSNEYETLLSVGNGYEENRSNALEVASEYAVIQYSHEDALEDGAYNVKSSIEISPEYINLSLNEEIIYDYDGSVNIDSGINIDADRLDIKNSNKIELYTNNSISSDTDAYDIEDGESNNAGSNILIDNFNGVHLSHTNDRFNDQYDVNNSFDLNENGDIVISSSVYDYENDIDTSSDITVTPGGINLKMSDNTKDDHEFDVNLTGVYFDGKKLITSSDVPKFPSLDGYAKKTDLTQYVKTSHDANGDSIYFAGITYPSDKVNEYGDIITTAKIYGADVAHENSISVSCDDINLKTSSTDSNSSYSGISIDRSSISLYVNNAANDIADIEPTVLKIDENEITINDVPIKGNYRGVIYSDNQILPSLQTSADDGYLKPNQVIGTWETEESTNSQVFNDGDIILLCHPNGDSYGNVGTNSKAYILNIYHDGDILAEWVDLSSDKADKDHNHDDAYAPKNHNHDDAYAPKNHNHDDAYAPKNHSHERFSDIVHFDNNVHICNNNENEGGWIYFGDSVDDELNPLVYICEKEDDILTIHARTSVNIEGDLKINGKTFISYITSLQNTISSLQNRINELENRIDGDCDSCFGSDGSCDSCFGVECDCNGYCDCDGSDGCECVDHCDCDGSIGCEGCEYNCDCDGLDCDNEECGAVWCKEADDCGECHSCEGEVCDFEWCDDCDEMYEDGNSGSW